MPGAATQGALFLRHKLNPRHPRLKGRRWESLDNEQLAAMVAQLALGQWRHVEGLLRSESGAGSVGPSYAINQAIRSLTVESGRDPWHRDGWVFQFISWIVAVESRKGDPARAPQMDQASKGFDGLQLVLNRNGSSVKGIIIFEDKASESPRDKVRDEVWPSFREMEAGERDAALASELASLLERLPHLNKLETVDRIMRDRKARRYRVSVTAGSHHAQGVHFSGLFDGYEEAVRGGRSRRYANVFEVNDLRAWMSTLSNRAVELLEAMRDV